MTPGRETVCSIAYTPLGGQVSDVRARLAEGRCRLSREAIHTLSPKGGRDMKRMPLLALCVAVSLGVVVTSFAVELEDPKKAPAGYVKVAKKGDKQELVFDTTTLSYSPARLNQVLSAYDRVAEAR
jgi:hypothetical protein